MPLSRRDFLKITALAGATVGIGTSALQRFLQTGELFKVTETHALMGTIVNFALIAPSQAQASVAIKISLDEMRRLSQIYNYRQTESPLGQLNANGITYQPPPELVATLQQALHFGDLSQGAFDITVKPILDALRENRPLSSELKELVNYRLLNITDAEISLTRPGMAITLDGIAKGSVIDGGVEILHSAGYENILVEAGGDIMAKSSPNGQVWKVGIAHPRQRNKFIETISIQNQAVATSGDYQNHFSADYSSYHIVDPRSGQSPTELASATVIAPSVSEADALSTTLMVLGSIDGFALIENLPETAALVVTKDMKTYTSSKFPHRING